MTKKTKDVQLLEFGGNQTRLILSDEDLSRVVTSALREVQIENLMAQVTEFKQQKDYTADKTLLQQFT
ncbi:hypothetical protein, partial [Shewanella sp.]|uniref:hypothetical protein n=1 Tax=Shewanella sp. TaxID=50422 RepID=UPI000E90DDD3